jgi:hypothetical protein
MMSKDKSELMVVMSKQELEDMLYRYGKICNDQLYKGLLNHINDILDRVDSVEEMVEYIKLSVQPKSRGRKKKAVEE